MKVRIWHWIIQEDEILLKTFKYKGKTWCAIEVKWPHDRAFFCHQLSNRRNRKIFHDWELMGIAKEQWPNSVWYTNFDCPEAANALENSHTAAASRERSK